VRCGSGRAVRSSRSGRPSPRVPPALTRDRPPRLRPFAAHDRPLCPRRRIRLGWAGLAGGLALGVWVVSAFFGWRSDRRTGRAEGRALDAERREPERHEREQAEAADRRRAHLHLEPMPPPMVDVVGRRTIVEASKHGFQLVDIPITDPIENDSTAGVESGSRRSS